MSNVRDLRLDKYGISQNRYRELKYFCKQYREKQAQLASITEISSPKSDYICGGSKSDKTANTAIRLADIKSDLEMIEQAAADTDTILGHYIIFNVADDVPFKYLNAPCGRRYFYEMRRKFFYILSKRKK